MLSRLRNFLVCRIRETDSPGIFFAYRLLLILSVCDWRELADLAVWHDVLSAMYGPVTIILVTLVEYWDRELRFWDIRVYLKKGGRYQLTIEKIKERHVEEVNWLIVFTFAGILSILDGVFSLLSS